MISVDFKFDIDQVVENLFGEKGIVDMATLDNTRQKQYFIKLSMGNDGWYKEEHLKESSL